MLVIQNIDLQKDTIKTDPKFIWAWVSTVETSQDMSSYHTCTIWLSHKLSSSIKHFTACVQHQITHLERTIKAVALIKLVSNNFFLPNYFTKMPEQSF